MAKSFKKNRPQKPAKNHPWRNPGIRATSKAWRDRSGFPLSRPVDKSVLYSPGGGIN